MSWLCRFRHKWHEFRYKGHERTEQAVAQVRPLSWWGSNPLRYHYRACTRCGEVQYNRDGWKKPTKTQKEIIVKHILTEEMARDIAQDCLALYPDCPLHPTP